MDFLKRSWVEIDLDALLGNLNEIKKAAGETPVMAVVKADAYGHGAACVAPVLQEAGVEYFAVSNIDEAVELRFAGITGGILILGHTPECYAEALAKNNISQAVMSAEYALALSEAAQKAGVEINIHIKVDTGMGRIGFLCREGIDPTESIISALGLPALRFEGIFTHFAVADTDGEYTKKQYELFSGLCRSLEEKGFKPRLRHCSNSAGIILHSDMAMDMVRAGIILYGLTPDTSLELPQGFRAAMSFYSTVAMIKELPEGESVSYGRTFTAEKNTLCATLPVGYADGFRRGLSSKGRVLLGGKKAPVLGRVCMDQCVIDISDIENVKIGDKVLLFGPGNPVEEAAALCDTINYEIVCGISRRVPRVYIKGGQQVMAKTYIYEEEK